MCVYTRIYIYIYILESSVCFGLFGCRGAVVAEHFLTLAVGLALVLRDRRSSTRTNRSKGYLEVQDTCDQEYNCTKKHPKSPKAPK